MRPRLRRIPAGVHKSRPYDKNVYLKQIGGRKNRIFSRCSVVQLFVRYSPCYTPTNRDIMSHGKHLNMLRNFIYFEHIYKSYYC